MTKKKKFNCYLFGEKLNSFMASSRLGSFLGFFFLQIEGSTLLRSAPA